MFIDESGNRYGRLIVGQRADNARDGGVRWLCLCDCGESAIVRGVMLRKGRTRSCGCLYRESRKEIGLVHGLARKGSVVPELYVWEGMRQRCFNPKNKAYPRYGGSGISVCDRWAVSFKNFLDDMGRRPEGKTLDRIDNTKGYEPGNCRWASRAEQQVNKRPLRERKSPKPNKTGHVGIRMTPGGKYRVTCNGRHIGTTHDLFEAIKMRRDAENEHEAARLENLIRALKNKQRGEHEEKTAAA